MKAGEALAIIGTAAAIGGGIGAYVELGHEVDARETAIGAQACVDTYGQDKKGNISQATLDCLKNGWVPGSHPVSLDHNLKAGNPSGFYTGYIKEERAKGSHLDVPPILGFAAIGLAAGLYITYKVAVDEAEESKGSEETASLPPRHSAATPAVNGGHVVSLAKSQAQPEN